MIVEAPKPNLSLQELEDLNNKTAPPVPPTPIVAGDGTPKPADLSAEQIKAAADAEAAKLTETQEAAAAQRLADLKAKDPTTLTAEEKAELDIENTPADEDEGSFWDAVDQLRGEKIDIDWSKHVDSAGTPVDPESPEGVLIREKAIAAKAVKEWDAHLEQNDPRSYAYFLHRQAGGTDEDFFAMKTVSLPDYETFTNSVDLQSKVYRDALVRKGVGEKQAQMIVDLAIKDKELFTLADKEYKDYKTAEKNELDTLTAQLAEDEKVQAQKVQALETLLTNEINTNSTMKFIVPDTKKAEFTQYVTGKIQTAEGKFFAVQEITEKALPRLLEALYLQFANGEISGLVQRAAKTQNVRRLKLAVDKSKGTIKDQSQGAGGKPTLGEL